MGDVSGGVSGGGARRGGRAGLQARTGAPARPLCWGAACRCRCSSSFSRPCRFPLASSPSPHNTRERARTHTRAHTQVVPAFSPSVAAAPKFGAPPLPRPLPACAALLVAAPYFPPSLLPLPSPRRTLAPSQPARQQRPAGGERGGGRREWGCLPLRRYRQSTCWCARARRAQRSRGRPRPPQGLLPPAACWKPTPSAAWTPPWRCPKP